MVKQNRNLLPALGETRKVYKNYLQNKLCGPGPLDVFASVLHYPLTFYLALGLFGFIFNGYFVDEDIQCFSQGGGLTEVKGYDLREQNILQICMAFGTIDVAGEKKSTLNYKWIPFLFVVLAAINYAPHMTKKVLRHERLEKFLKNVHHLSKEEIRDYAYENIGSHAGQLTGGLKISLVCLICDIVSLFLLDIAANNTFFNVIAHGPYSQYADEYNIYSRVFPAFTKCSLTPKMGMAVLNTENYGCSLPLNYYYAHLFIVLLVFFMFVAVFSTFSVVVNLFRVLPFGRQKWVSLGGHYLDCEKKIASKWNGDELYVLNTIKTNI
ncbi:uncharacterized protein LOC121855254 [Homarus americanus]|uniref:uncharacterized protein LOC121855254 n=1 Tax=Homarus americanus TaxID=6706 RepID=UPI001C48969A|nr:uncharacterized protein LOC121855254 [Homarus americanus]